MYATSWINPYTQGRKPLPICRTFDTLEEAQADMRQEPPLAEHCNLWNESTERIIASRIHYNGRDTYWSTES